MDFTLMIFYFMLFLLLVVGGVIWIVRRIFRHKIILKDVTGGKKIVHILTAREFNEEGVNRWGLFKSFRSLKSIDAPPVKSIDVDRKGRKVAVGYIDEQDSIVWDSDETVDLKNIKHDTLSANQKRSYLNQARKSVLKQKLTFGQMVFNTLPIIGMVIIILVLVLGFEDFSKPFLDSKQLEVQFQEKQVEQLKLMSEMRQSIQRIDSEQEVMNNKLDEINNNVKKVPN